MQRATRKPLACPAPLAQGAAQLGDLDGAGQDYERFCRYLESVCGITLGANKAYLVRSRLGRLMQEEGIGSLGELVHRLEGGAPAALRVRVIDAMTTNETLWFRDEYPFEVLKSVILPELGRRGSPPIRIWSAACSSGQEPYSISMAVSEYLAQHPGGLPAGVEILGSDISVAMLTQARSALYDELEVRRGLSEERRLRFFVREGDRLRVREDVRRRVQFREVNLLQGFAPLGTFDVVFCRNVLIYFSNENKRDILHRIARVLRARGFLFLGGSEPLGNYSSEFDMLRCPRGVVYRLRS